MTSRASRSARPSATRCCRAASRRATWCSASARPACTRTAIRSPARSSSCRGLAWDAPCPFAPGMTLGEALLDADAHLCALLPRGDPRDRRREGARAHHRRRLHREHSARAAEGLGVRIELARVPVLPVFKWLAATGGIAETEMLRTFNCGIGMIVVVGARQGGRRRRTCSGARAKRSTRLGEVIAQPARRAARRLRRHARSR